MRISLVSKGDASNTCPYCRDTIELGEGRRCNKCRTTLHRECAEELHKCPTPGCGRSLSRRYRDRGAPAASPRIGFDDGELSDGAKHAIGFAAVIGILIGACLVIPGDKKKKRRRAARQPEVVVKIADEPAFRRVIPKWSIGPGPPFRLSLRVREWTGRPARIVIEPGTEFVAPGPDGVAYLALNEAVFKVRRGRSYSFPVVPLDPTRWQDRPPSHLQVRSRYRTDGRHQRLVRRWIAQNIRRVGPETSVAALWYLGHEGALVPEPSPPVRRAARRILARLTNEPSPTPTPRAKVRRAAPQRLLRDLRYDPTRRVSAAQLARLAPYASDPRVVKLVRSYLTSEEPYVEVLALQWLRRHAPATPGEQQAPRLVTSSRADRILILEGLRRRGQGKYAPLELVYARDLAVDGARLEAFTRAHPKAIPLIAKGTSPYRAWAQLVGWSSDDRARLEAIGRVLERDEEQYVRKTLERLQPGSIGTAHQLAISIQRLARRFPDHPALWKRLEELSAHSDRWVRTLAINAATRSRYGGRILARIVGDAAKPVAIREEAALGSRYMKVTAALEVWRIAALGPDRVQRALLGLITGRRSAILRSHTLGAEVRGVLETMSRSKDADVAKRSVEMVFELKLPDAVGFLRRCQVEPSMGRLAILAAVRYLRPPGKYAEQAAAELRRLARYARSAHVRRVALNGAAGFGHSRDLVRLLRRVLTDEDDPTVRAAAARVPELIPVRPGRSFEYGPLSKSALHDGSAAVRRAALSSALKWSGAALVRTAGKEDTDRRVRLQAYRVLLPAHRTTARRVLFDWLARTDVRDQRLAVQMLIQDFPRDQYAKKKLRGLTHHRDDSIRNQVRTYLETIAR